LPIGWVAFVVGAGGQQLEDAHPQYNNKRTNIMKHSCSRKKLYYQGLLAISIFFMTSMMAFAQTMPVPTTQQIFTEVPITLPVVDNNPTLAKPIGMGTIATGGKSFSLKVLGQFSGPVDVYLGVYAPALFGSTEIYIIKPDDLSLQPASVGLEPWRAGVWGVDGSLFGEIPVAAFPDGEYTLYLAVTPIGTLPFAWNSFYIWETSFSLDKTIVDADGNRIPIIPLIPESRSTYDSIQAMVEPRTGLPHDKFDASLFDILSQFATVRAIPHTNMASGASLESSRCTNTDCRYSGNYGLKFEYNMPSGMWGSFNVDSHGFDVSSAAYLEAWVKGAQGGERFEFVLWDDCQGGFPGRPETAVITATQNWEQKRLSLRDFQVDMSSLCRLSIGFNDAMHSRGTVYLDKIAFVDSDGNRIPSISLDEDTNVTNIGLYMASVLGALEMEWKDYNDVVAKLSTTLTSIERLQKWHGFPQTHNHVVSLTPYSGDTCISTVDLGNLAAGIILLRQRIPELSDRAGALLNAMDWSWLYDDSVGLPYGCRYPDGSASEWHYDWLAADSRLAHFIGIGTGKMPADSWNNLNRDKESSLCASLAQDHFKPSWDGGGLFMGLLPAIFLDEAESELGISHRNFVQDQICYAEEIGAPAWGWSATALPPYGAEYCGYDCEQDGLDNITPKIDNIIVPHASILAADYVSLSELTQNLHALETLGARASVTDGNQGFDFGFRASVDWRKNEVATLYLVLDQSMAFLSLVNHVTNGRIRSLFCQDEITQAGIIQIPDYSNSCGN